MEYFFNIGQISPLMAYYYYLSDIIVSKKNRL